MQRLSGFIMILATLFFVLLPSPGQGSPGGHFEEVITLAAEDGKRIQGQARGTEVQSSPAKQSGTHGLTYGLEADRLEFRWPDGNQVLFWDAEVWVGMKRNKLYLESEAERSLEDDLFEELELEILFGREIAQNWEVLVGVGHLFEPDPESSFASLGFEGEPVERFETEVTASISEDGDLSGSLEFEYDLFLTDQFVLQPRMELGAALQEVEEYETGEGLTDINLGIRLRYEIVEALAPYFGFTWTHALGETANLIEAAGGDDESSAVVAGIMLSL